MQVFLNGHEMHFQGFSGRTVLDLMRAVSVVLDDGLQISSVRRHDGDEEMRLYPAPERLSEGDEIDIEVN